MSEEWLDDARKIPDEVMSFIRKIAVRAIEKDNISPETVSEVLGISRTAIYAWMRRYHEGGYGSLNTRNPPGVPCIITHEMDMWLRDTVLNHTPIYFGYDTVLWTRDILAKLLNERFGVQVGGTAVSAHLKNIGLSYQKPWFRSREQNPKEFEHFLNDTFPKIQKLAEKMGADIGFEYESGIGLRTHSGKTWGAVGKTPEVSITGKRGGYNMISIVTADGTLTYSIRDVSIDSDEFIDFLTTVLANRIKPLILVLDRASFHASKNVRDFVRSRRDKIRIFFLPRYSPELNPDEQVWNEVKSKEVGRKFIKTKLELKKKIESVIQSLQINTGKIKSFFLLPNTKYASQPYADTP